MSKGVLLGIIGGMYVLLVAVSIGSYRLGRKVEKELMKQKQEGFDLCSMIETQIQNQTGRKVYVILAED